ncbi:MAG: sulfotransferase family 2 domain-containing protein [Anaerolineales bacterium]|nr:sulfotransferase family 2 domain-containing protein [Anaerolineales bacterium]
MRISHQYRFVFLAFPRTASTSIRRLLEPYSDICSVHKSEITPDFPYWHHMPAQEAKHAFEQQGWDWFTYRRFCVVRNPYDRAVSLFRHRREKDALRHSLPRLRYRALDFLYKHLPVKLAFGLFVTAIQPHFGVAQGLKAFISDDQGRPLVDHFLRYEDLEMELPNYLETLGISIHPSDMPHLNVSLDRKPYLEWYNAYTQRHIANKYRYEIDKFGYQIAENP